LFRFLIAEISLLAKKVLKISSAEENNSDHILSLRIFKNGFIGIIYSNNCTT